MRNLQISPPVTMHDGQTLHDLRISCDGSRPAVRVPPGVHGVRIVGNEIGPCTGAEVGILAEPGSGDITVEGNVIHGVATGFWAMHAQHPIVFDNNYVYDVRGPFPRGQMVQLDNVSSGSGESRISGNVSDWFARTGPTAYEDHISLYMSSGSEQNPIVIEGNKLRGGDSDTGSGIMIGDEGGGHVVVRKNIVVAVPNTGIGIASGAGLVVAENLIYSAYGPALRTRTALSVHSTSGLLLEDNSAIASYCDSEGVCDRHSGLWIGSKSTHLGLRGNNWFDVGLGPDIWRQKWNGRRWDKN